jgi:hypothetical protein
MHVTPASNSESHEQKYGSWHRHLRRLNVFVVFPFMYTTLSGFQPLMMLAAYLPP